MSDSDHKSFSARLKDSMSPWIFKKDDYKTAKTANSDPPATDAASAPTDAPTSAESIPDSGDTKKMDTVAGKTGRVRGRLWHRKGEKKKE